MGRDVSQIPAHRGPTHLRATSVSSSPDARQQVLVPPQKGCVETPKGSEGKGNSLEKHPEKEERKNSRLLLPHQACQHPNEVGERERPARRWGRARRTSRCGGSRRRSRSSPPSPSSSPRGPWTPGRSRAPAPTSPSSSAASASPSSSPRGTTSPRHIPTPPPSPFVSTLCDCTCTSCFLLESLS